MVCGSSPGAQTVSLLLREKVVVDYMRRVPGGIDPYDALCAVVWPSDELIGYFPFDGECLGCGGPMSEKTAGCKNCYQRHYNYDKGIRHHERHPGSCGGCGTPYEHKTKGCKTCIDRHQRRNRRMALAL
jgi:hypothetical protein